MTREEAIEELYRIVENQYRSAEKDKEALSMAIEALEQIADLKESYNKGYDDGREAIAFHLELCKEEGSVITVPDGATNGDMIKALFPDKELWQTITSICLSTFDHNYAEIYKSSWWNSPYRKEQE